MREHGVNEYLTHHMADVYLHIMIMMIVVISVMTVYTKKHLPA